MPKTQNITPPNWVLRFFRWFCNPDFVEDLEGDLFERFERSVDKKSLNTARWLFITDVLKLFRPSLMKSLKIQKLNNTTMVNNYYKVAWRHIVKEKFYSIINISGLAVGMASCIFIAFYVLKELSYDQYHENLDRTYRILQGAHAGEERDIPPTPENFRFWGNAPVGPALKEELPEVEYFCRFTPGHSKLIKANHELYNEKNVVYGDSTVFKVFSWNLIAGNPDKVLTEPNSIVLTEKLAKKYFGTTDVLGKTVILEQERECVVTGVMEDVPNNSQFIFDGIISMATFYDIRPGIFDNWGYVDFYNYITLKEGTSVESIKPKLQPLGEKYTSDWEHANFYLD
ncbi:MAG: ABC transporter permease, partial [Fulvivirga sp.]